MAKPKRTASQRGRSNRAKGSRNEIAACEVLRPIAPDCRRNFGQSRARGEVPDIGPVPGYWVEVGAGSVNPRAKHAQACEEVDSASLRFTLNNTPTPTPIALTREIRRGKTGPWLVTMAAEAWLELVRKARLWDEQCSRIGDQSWGETQERDRRG
jgi:hypothetical protein